MDKERQLAIARLNDATRRELLPGHAFTTSSIANLPTYDRMKVLQLVQTFDQFNFANDPYQEHDFGAFDYNEVRYFWKIDTYADHTKEFGAEDPLADTAFRVITIGKADDY